MSTNTSDPTILDARVLEQMANAMFRESGGYQPLPVSSSPPAAVGDYPNVSAYQPVERNGVDVREPQTSHHDPHFGDTQPVPASVAGRGVSPDAGQINQFGATLPQTLPDTRTTTHGVVPGSVAGSGVSPSVTEHSQNFNIHDPQTSHADPHLATPGVIHGASPGIIPVIIPPSLPGLGISPSSFGLPSMSSIQGGSSPEFGSPDALPFGNVSLESDLQRQANSLFADTPDFRGVSSIHDQRSVPNQNFQYGQGFPHGQSDLNISPAFYFVDVLHGSPFGHGEGSRAYLSGKDRLGLTPSSFNVNQVKRDFPILEERVNGKPIVWLDNAATTQKPKQVIDRISYFYEHENSNIHRAAHALAARATDAYEEARRKVQQFLHAASPNEIVFVRGATEAINLVAKSWGEQNLQPGDEIIVSHLEHHANIVPWQQLAWRKGLKIRVIPVDDTGQVLLDEYARLLGPKTKLVAFTQVSNALGTVTPARQIVDMGHSAGARVLVDGAQSVSHMPVDVQALGCDWFVFSGHKVFGPTGIGVVYGRESLLNDTQPWQGGGNMIADVTFEETKFQPAPSRFEAGTGNIADAVGLGAAIDYVTRLGMEAIHQYETYLLQYATLLMRDVPGLRMIGTAAEKASVLSFVFEGYRTEEVGTALNEEGIAVRAGHHCAQPILRRFGQETTVRPSLAFYNTCADVDLLVATLFKLRDRRPLKKK